MVNDNIIAITCEGIKVEGIITTRSSGNISVEITSPYLHLSKALRKSFFARYPSSFLSAYGDEKAEQLLTGLFEFGLFLEQNMDDLKNKYSELEEMIAQRSMHSLCREEFNQKRRELKRKLRHGGIDNKEYQGALMPLRKELEENEYQISQMKRTFFEKNVPESVSCGMIEEVIMILKGEKELKI